MKNRKGKNNRPCEKFPTRCTLPGLFRSKDTVSWSGKETLSVFLLAGWCSCGRVAAEWLTEVVAAENVSLPGNAGCAVRAEKRLNSE